MFPRVPTFGVERQFTTLQGNSKERPKMTSSGAKPVGQNQSGKCRI